MRGLKFISPIVLLYLIVLFFIYSCSTTRVLLDNESRLKENNIKITNSKEFSPQLLEPYLKQTPNSYFLFGWNPFLNIYNWSNGKNGGWDKFVKKIGQEPVLFDKELVGSSVNNINNHLNYIGYYNSTVLDSIVTKNKKSSVYYNITLGKRYIIDTVTYNVEDIELAHIFFNNNLDKIINRGDYLSEDYLSKAADAITNEIRDNGYFRFSKNYLFFTADTLDKSDKCNLHLDIKNYSRNESKENSINHNKYYFSNVNIVPMRKSLELLNYEFVGDSVVAVPIRENNRLYDTLYMDRYKISYKDNLILREKLVDRLNLIKEGDIYSQKRVEETYNLFSNLRLFNSVNVNVNELDSTNVECQINLSSSQIQGYKLNLELSSNSSGLMGVSPSVSYFHKNLFKGAEILTTNFMGDFQFALKSKKRSNEFGISTCLSLPTMLFIPNKIVKGDIPRTEFGLSYNFQERPEYTRNIISGNYSYTWSSKEKFFYKITPLQVNIVKLYNLNTDFYNGLEDPFLKNSYKDHFDLGLGTTFYYTTNSSPNPTSSYFYFRWQNDLSGNLLSIFNNLMNKDGQGSRLVWDSPYSQYYRTEMQGVYTFKFGKNQKQALAVRGLAGIGIGYGNSVALPFEKLFWSGGANSLRAWQARTVGPGYSQIDTVFTIPNQSGDLKLEANIEYRFPLLWNFEGALFIDAGNVWQLKRSLRTSINDKSINPSYSVNGVFYFRDFYKHLASNWGAGLRLNLGFALLRLDMGLKIYDPPTFSWIGPNMWLKKGNYGIQFGVGYPF